MDLYELTRLADMMDEDASGVSDFTLEDANERKGGNPSACDFKEKYLSFYDDIKTNPRDDW